MRTPPPLSRFPAFPVTGGVGLLALAVTVASMRGADISPVALDVRAFWAQPWRVLTSALPHVNVLHLGFNLIWLWNFGTAVEERWGHLSTLLLFALFQCGAALAEYALFSGGVGLSGVGYGLFGLLWVLSRRDPRFEDCVDARTAKLFAGWFVFCIAMTALGAMRVANVAHGVGMVLGLLVGGATTLRGAKRGAAIALVPAILGVSLAGATAYRPRVNLARDGGQDSSYLGYRALTAGRHDEAVRHLSRAVEVSPRSVEGWFNLALAHQRAGHDAEALAAFRRAVAIDPRRQELREGLVAYQLAAGARALEGGRAEDALVRYRDALEVTPEGAGRAPRWYDVGVALDRLHRDDEALAAFERARALDGAQPSYGRAVALYKARAALRALERGDDAQAAGLLREATAIDPGEASFWHNYAVALERTGRADEAREALAREAQLRAADAGGDAGTRANEDGGAGWD